MFEKRERERYPGMYYKMKLMQRIKYVYHLYILEIPWFRRKHFGSTQMSIELVLLDLNKKRCSHIECLSQF